MGHFTNNSKFPSRLKYSASLRWMCAPKAAFGVTFLFFPFLPVPSISSSQAQALSYVAARHILAFQLSLETSLILWCHKYLLTPLNLSRKFKLICGGWVWLLLNCQTPFSHRLGPNSSHATPIQRNWNISNIFHNCQSPISSFSPLALNQIMRDSFSTEIFPNQGLQDIK